MGVQYITTNDGVRLAYEIRGKAGTPKIVLIHGWSGSRKAFDLNFQDLAKQCQVYTFDLRHHGDSDRPGWVRQNRACILRDDAVACTSNQTDPVPVLIRGIMWHAWQQT